MRKVVSLLLSMVFTINIIGATVYAGDYKEKFYIEYDGEIYRYNSRIVSLEVDGEDVNTGDMPAVIIDGRTLVPVREVFESEGIDAEVIWNNDTREVYITYEDKLVVVQIDSNIAYVNENQVELDVPAKLIRDITKDYAKTMIPLRFVSENLGFEVEWVEESYTAKLFSRVFVQSGYDQTIDEVDSQEGIINENIDQTDNEEEKLDTLDSDKASAELPTPLYDNPVNWISDGLDTGEDGSDEKDDDSDESMLSDEEHDEVEVTDVDFTNEDGINRLIIKATGPMSAVNVIQWDGKFILDIKNALFALDDDESSYQLSYTDNPIVNSVRSSQQQPNDDGNEVLRIVYDMINPSVEYSLYFNEDRTELIYEMATSTLTGITIGQNKEGDYIELVGNTLFDIDTFRLSGPDRLVFDLNNTISLLGFNEETELEGQYLETVRTAQFDYETTRLVVETIGQSDYEIKYEEDNKTIIQFLEPSYDNITYENSDTPKIVLEDSEEHISISEIIYEDNYRDYEYIITLPGNYEDIFGDGEININDDIIESIEISEDEDGRTKLIIKEKGIYVFRVEQEGDDIVIKAYTPQEVYSQIVVIDTGHGGKDPGAVVDEMTENELNMYITDYLVEYLEDEDSVKTYYTRLEDEYVSLQERCDLANYIDADFFISIHNNAYYSQFDGTQTLFFEDDDRPGLNSFELADILQENVVDELGLADDGTRASNTLYVLKNTNMPAVLLEGGFMTSPIDIEVLKEPKGQKNIAEGIYEAILEVFEEFPTGREDMVFEDVVIEVDVEEEKEEKESTGTSKYIDN